jgi:hypothetical protein
VGGEQVGVDDPHVWAVRAVDGGVDGAAGGEAAGVVVVERKDDALDAEFGEVFEEGGRGGGLRFESARGLLEKTRKRRVFFCPRSAIGHLRWARGRPSVREE